MAPDLKSDFDDFERFFDRKLDLGESPRRLERALEEFRLLLGNGSRRATGDVGRTTRTSKLSWLRGKSTFARPLRTR